MAASRLRVWLCLLDTATTPPSCLGKWGPCILFTCICLLLLSLGGRKLAEMELLPYCSSQRRARESRARARWSGKERARRNFLSPIHLTELLRAGENPIGLRQNGASAPMWRPQWPVSRFVRQCSALTSSSSPPSPPPPPPPPPASCRVGRVACKVSPWREWREFRKQTQLALVRSNVGPSLALAPPPSSRRQPAVVFPVPAWRRHESAARLEPGK